LEKKAENIFKFWLRLFRDSGREGTRIVAMLAFLFYFYAKDNA